MLEQYPHGVVARTTFGYLPRIIRFKGFAVLYYIVCIIHKGGSKEGVEPLLDMCACLVEELPDW